MTRKLYLTLFLISPFVIFSQNFEENKGQVTGNEAEKVKFTYKFNGLTVFLMNDGLVYQFTKTQSPEEGNFDDFANAKEEDFENNNNSFVETYRMDLKLIGANTEPKISMEGKGNDYTNYYTENTFEVFNYKKIIFHNIYPNIDWVIYTNKDELKYDFIVNKGGDPTQIKLKFEWAEEMFIDMNGNLNVKNKMGTIKEKKPFSYQGNKIINSSFYIENNYVGFKLNSYNPEETLIIDPIIEWATYYGGTTNDYSYSSVVDLNGNVYCAGGTNSSNNIADGGHQISFSGGHQDAFLVKFNSDGVRQWATYYGGSESDYGRCALDSMGYVYLFGSTRSTSNIADGGHQNTLNGTLYDAFLVKFDSDGVRQWATYYGGDDEDRARACAVDALGNVYLSGRTLSISDIADGGHQNTHGGGSSDAFLVKFNADGIRQWATYYGGDDLDWAWGCSVDANNNVFLSGWTGSPNNIALSGHQNTKSGLTDAYLAKFNSDGVLQWGTYYGGSLSDRGRSCITDRSGNIYLTGFSESSNNIFFNGHQSTHGGGWDDAFLVKFNPDGIREWGTYYGGNGEDLGWISAVDDDNNVYLCGMTTSTNNISYGGHQMTFGGGADDAFLVKFDSTGIRQWATYYGGSLTDRGWACGTAGNDFVYLTGSTNSSSNISQDGHQNSIGGSEDGFLVKFNANGFIDVSSLESNTIEYLKIYPNPTNEGFYISDIEGIVEIHILNLNGSIIKTFRAEEKYFNISEFPNGVYTIQIIYNETVLTNKIVKN